MRFRNLDPKDLIVRIRGKNCSSAEYGIVANKNNSLSYYPLCFHTHRRYANQHHFFYHRNSWLAGAARADLDLPKKLIYGENRDLLNKHSDQIEDRMKDISELDLKEKVDIYMDYGSFPYVIELWRNRVWPIPEDHLDHNQKNVRDLFLKRGEFS